MSDCATNLAKAKDAMAMLASGAQAVEVQYSDRRVRYAQVDLDTLRKYVRELEAECGGDAGRRRPFGMSF